METLVVAGLIGCVSLLYTTAGQAGGTAFLAVMAFAAFPAVEMRPTALLLNIVAAGYATWQLYQRAAIDRRPLVPLIAPSLVTAFVGGMVVLAGRTYFILTGVLLIVAAALMALRGVADAAEARPPHHFPLVVAGAGTGFVSGLTGVGGGVFLTPVLIVSGWMSPRRAAALSPPFILCNSTVGLIGALLAGQTLAPGTLLYSLGALTGAIAGTAIGLRWFTERITRYALAIILLFAGLRLVTQ
jgi:uncharacterized protein